MPIKITINGAPATALRGKNQLEGLLAGGLTNGLTQSVLDAVIAEIPIDHDLPAQETWRSHTAVQ